MVYGGFYHRIPVSRDARGADLHRGARRAADAATPMPPDAPPGMEPFPPPEMFAPPMKFVQAVKTTKSTVEESELAVNRAVTFAGIIRDQQGEIIRVSGAAEGPAFCPT